MGTLSISAKNLGSLALKNSCDRCSWIQLHTAFKLPFQIFPGIFSSIDSYTKRVINGYLETEGKPPGWLDSVGKITASLPTPGFKKFSTSFEDYDIRLTGALDALFQLADGTLCVGDYKTAKFTGHQDDLLPMYSVQLNGYAAIAEALGMGHVSKLTLIYFEPETDDQHTQDKLNLREFGFAMGFSTHVLDLELDSEKWLFPYLKRAREIYDREIAPAENITCENCSKVALLMELMNKRFD